MAELVVHMVVAAAEHSEVDQLVLLVVVQAAKVLFVLSGAQDVVSQAQIHQMYRR